jgi:hypothetical protein
VVAMLMMMLMVVGVWLAVEERGGGGRRFECSGVGSDRREHRINHSSGSHSGRDSSRDVRRPISERICRHTSSDRSTSDNRASMRGPNRESCRRARIRDQLLGPLGRRRGPSLLVLSGPYQPGWRPSAGLVGLGLVDRIAPIIVPSFINQTILSSQSMSLLLSLTVFLFMIVEGRKKAHFL